MNKTLKTMLLAFVIVFLSACGQQVKITENTPTANLSELTFADIKIGDALSDVDLTRFHNDNKNPLWTYSFDEVYIKADENGIITRLQTSTECNLFQGGKSKSAIKSIFGESPSYSYDSEQKLEAFSYADRENNTALTIVYSGDYIVWAILEKITDGT
jgi:hypothetical protein